MGIQYNPLICSKRQQRKQDCQSLLQLLGNPLPFKFIYTNIIQIFKKQYNIGIHELNGVWSSTAVVVLFPLTGQSNSVCFCCCFHLAVRNT